MTCKPRRRNKKMSISKARPALLTRSIALTWGIAAGVAALALTLAVTTAHATGGPAPIGQSDTRLAAGHSGGAVTMGGQTVSRHPLVGLGAEQLGAEQLRAEQLETEQWPP